MTCIVGLVHNNKVYMGGDSAGVSGYDITIREDAKVFNNNGFIIGFTTSFRMGQILRFNFVPPKIECNDLYKYMCTAFIDGIRTTFKNAGYLKIKDSEESGGMFLVGYKGNLYTVDNDFQVGIPSDKCDSVGCGSSYAMGSLFTSEFIPNMLPKDRIELALQAATYFNGGVRKPFIFCEED